MDTETNKIDDGMDWYWNPDPKEEAEEEARDALYRPKEIALMDKVRAGDMTEEDCAVALAKLRREMGYISPYTPEQDLDGIRNFLWHCLHGDERERIKRETGTILD